jgi:hypothetical protein
MALAGKQAGRGLALSPSPAAVLPRPVVSARCRQLASPKLSRSFVCKATIELPPDLQAELDELEKAAHCGSEGEVVLHKRKLLLVSQDWA